MLKVAQEILDELGSLEIEALREGLKDPELRKNPAFLAKVREFLKQNDFKISSEMEGVQGIQKDVADIPNFDFGTQEVQ